MTNMQRQVWEKQETGIEIEVEGMAVGERDMGPGPGLWALNRDSRTGQSRRNPMAVGAHCLRHSRARWKGPGML